MILLTNISQQTHFYGVKELWKLLFVLKPLN